MSKTYEEKRGEELEKAIGDVLWHTDGYGHVLKNLYIPKINEKETELDVVFIHETGIYVIEAKNYSGKIYGSEKYNQWRKYINGEEYLFYSPLEQNRNHIKALQRQLPESVKRTDIYSIIVFGNDCEIKKMEVNTPNLSVLQLWELQGFIQDIVFDEKRESVFTPKEIDSIYKQLYQYEKRNQKEKSKDKATYNSKPYQTTNKSSNRKPNLPQLGNSEYVALLDRTADKNNNVKKSNKQGQSYKSKSTNTKKKKKKEKLIFQGISLLILLGGLNAFGNSYQDLLESKKEVQPIVSTVKTNEQQVQQQTEVKEEVNPIELANKEVNDKIQNSPNQRITEKEAYALIDNQLAKPFFQGFKKNPVVGNYKWVGFNESRYSYSRIKGNNLPSEHLSVGIYFDEMGVKKIFID